jgi:hypothetical protein
MLHSNDPNADSVESPPQEQELQSITHEARSVQHQERAGRTARLRQELDRCLQARTAIVATAFASVLEFLVDMQPIGCGIAPKLIPLPNQCPRLLARANSCDGNDAQWVSLRVFTFSVHDQDILRGPLGATARAGPAPTATARQGGSNCGLRLVGVSYSLDAHACVERHSLVTSSKGISTVKAVSRYVDPSWRSALN